MYSLVEPPLTTTGVRIGRAVLLLLLTVYFATSAAYNLAVPVGEAPDEVAHIEYVQILLNTGNLPTIPKNSPRYNYEAEQPPLYYLLQATWIRLLWPDNKLLPDLKENPAFSFRHMTDPANAYLHDYPASDEIPAHLMRFLSTLMGAAMLVLIWNAARSVWPADMGTAIIATGFAALLPGTTFMFGVVNNDSLAAVMGTATLFTLLLAARRGVTVRGMLVVGLVLGLSLLAKRSLLALLPLLVLVPLILPVSNRQGRWLAMLAGLGAAAVVGIWPFLQNLAQYGDPFATAATEQAKQAINSPLGDIPGFWLLPGYVVNLFNSLWGVFGLRSIELPGIVYGFYYGLCGLALLGLLYHYRVRRLSKEDRIVILLMAAALLLIYAGVAYQNTHFWAIQGRLLLPAFAALALLVGRGISLLGQPLLITLRTRVIVLASMIVILTLLNWYALLWHLIPAYYH